jgi:hypothetical protein
VRHSFGRVAVAGAEYAHCGSVVAAGAECASRSVVVAGAECASCGSVVVAGAGCAPRSVVVAGAECAPCGSVVAASAECVPRSQQVSAGSEAGDVSRGSRAESLLGGPPEAHRVEV